MDIFRKIKILSLEQATVTPYLTYRLAMDGMEIIRLEHPVYGDPNRMIGENVLGEERMNAYYLCINAGKKALTLNLADPEGQELFHSLLKELSIDVFITNQLPRNYKKLGIDYDALKAVKPDIIWLGITGFGPDSNEGAYDPILQARSGLMEMTGEPDGAPQVLGIPLPDMGTSEHAYGLLMKALFKRQVSGEGTRVDLAMFESSASWLTVPVTMSASFKKEATRRGNTHEFFSPVSVYKSNNGYVYLAVGNDRQWKAMVSLDMFKSLDKPDYEKNKGRIRDVRNLNQAIDEMIADPLVERRLLGSRDPATDREITLAPPPNMTPFLEENDRMLSFPPRFGEHNQEIYGKMLGCSDEELARLKENGVI